MKNILAFYGNKISQNRVITPEKFLIIYNCPLARVGMYEYLGREIGLDSDEIINVYRNEDEVFSTASIASFNGKSITDNHPPILLDSQNNSIYEKGTVINVRRGKGEESDLLLGDLIIKNPTLIQDIESNKKKEISCGYDCLYEEDGNGNYIQKQIRGNHVAIVESGRAGVRVSVKDEKIKSMEGEKKKMTKIKIPKQQRGPITNLFAAMGIKHFAMDAEPQEIADALDSLAEERKEEEEDPKSEEAKESKDSSCGKDAEPNDISALTAKVDKLTDIINKLVSSDKEVHKEVKAEDAIDEMIEELSAKGNSTGDEEESVTVPVEEMDEEIIEGAVQDPADRPKNPITNADSAAMIRALKAMKPVIAAIKDPTERKVACDSLMVEFKKAKKTASKANGYQRITDAQRTNAASKQKTADSKEKNFQAIEDSYSNKNPHKVKKEMK